MGRHVARMRRIEMRTGFCWESPKERNHLEDVGADGRKNTGSIKAQIFWTKLGTMYLQEGQNRTESVRQS
jgi:hypothetical protein